mgnify:CR=1 FL=1
MVAQRPVLPNTTYKVKAPYRKDGHYFQVAGGTNDIRLAGEELFMQGGRAGTITDEPPALYDRFEKVDCLTRMGPSDQPLNWKYSSLWVDRIHGLKDSKFVRVRGVDLTPPDDPTLSYNKEHDKYLEHAEGELLLEDCSSLNMAAQALQIRLKYNAADYRWARPRHLIINRYNAQECGQKRGAGRAGFSISLKDYGPNGEIDAYDLFIRTVKQRQVSYKTINKQVVWYDSFGGLCVEFAKRVNLQRGYIEMKNPNRHGVQFFNDLSGLTNPTGCAPLDLTVHDYEFANGLHCAVRIERDTQKIDIRRCKGNGLLKVFRMGADGVYRMTSVPITQGLAY